MAVVFSTESFKAISTIEVPHTDKSLVDAVLDVNEAYEALDTSTQKLAHVAKVMDTIQNALDNLAKFGDTDKQVVLTALNVERSLEQFTRTKLEDLKVDLCKEELSAGFKEKIAKFVEFVENLWAHIVLYTRRFLIKLGIIDKAIVDYAFDVKLGIDKLERFFEQSGDKINMFMSGGLEAVTGFDVKSRVILPYDKCQAFIEAYNHIRNRFTHLTSSTWLPDIEQKVAKAKVAIRSGDWSWYADNKANNVASAQKLAAELASSPFFKFTVDDNGFFHGECIWNYTGPTTVKDLGWTNVNGILTFCEWYRGFIKDYGSVCAKAEKYQSVCSKLAKEWAALYQDPNVPKECLAYIRNSINACTANEATLAKFDGKMFAILESHFKALKRITSQVQGPAK